MHNIYTLRDTHTGTDTQPHTHHPLEKDKEYKHMISIGNFMYNYLTGD